MHLYTKQSFIHAHEYLDSQARPIEKTIFNYDFANGKVEEVVEALATFRNSDGGFGHGLEPDIRIPDSSALATTLALGILKQINAPPSHPLIQGAIEYLRATLDETTFTWRLIPLSTNNAPHAPWMHDEDSSLRKSFSDFLINPRAEIVALLYHFGDDKLAQWLNMVALKTTEAIMSQSLDMHELVCATTFIETRAVPAAYRKRAFSKVSEIAKTISGTSPSDWQGYTPQPLLYAPTPESPLAKTLSESIPANLDFLIQQQTDSGTWEPTWNWGTGDPAWNDAKREWIGFLTLKNLRILRAWGRLES
jgi:hypothetical protein